MMKSTVYCPLNVCVSNKVNYNYTRGLRQFQLNTNCGLNDEIEDLY